MPRRLELTEEQMQAAEDRIPAIAAAAGRAAYEAALAELGSAVIVNDAGDLVEHFADGAERFIKTMPPGLHAQVGTVLRRRS